MANIAELFQQIRSEIVSLEEEATKAQKIVTEYEQKKIDVEIAAEEFPKYLAQVKRESEEQSVTYTNIRDRLSKEVSILREENSQLTQRKSELMIANSKLENDNLRLQKYEEKTWKVLNAKDEELKVREAAVTQKENFAPRSKSFLPPIE